MNRGGIYTGSEGQELYGNGGEVETLSDLEMSLTHRQKIQASWQELFDVLQGIVDSEQETGSTDDNLSGLVCVSAEAMEKAKTLLESL